MSLKDNQKMLLALAIGYYYINYSTNKQSVNRSLAKKNAIRHSDEVDDPYVQEYLDAVEYIHKGNEITVSELLEGLEFEIENFGEIYDEFYGNSKYELVNKRLEAYNKLGIKKSNYINTGISKMESALEKYETNSKVKEALITLGITEDIYDDVIEEIEKYYE